MDRIDVVVAEIREATARTYACGDRAAGDAAMAAILARHGHTAVQAAADRIQTELMARRNGL